jgi:hypothetical protein
MKTICLFPLTVLTLGALASAQSFEPALGVLAPRNGFAAGYGDDVLFDLQPLNFAFPMGGVAASYTHAHVQSNGVIFLTNGAPSNATTTGYSTSPSVQLANLRGAVGQPPRIAPMWRDLDNLAANGGGVFVNNTLPGKFVATWSNTVQYGTAAPLFTMQVQLFATGEVHFFYGGSLVSNVATICGVSEGNAVAEVRSIDLTAAAGNSDSSRLLYEQFPADAIDLQNRFVHFAPNVYGGYDQTATESGAFNRSYGKGCYELSDSFYQLFPDAAHAATALANHSLVLTPSGTQYAVSWSGGVFVPPTAAAVNVFGMPADDDEQVVTPTVPFPSPAGPQATLRVHSNGLISWGPAAQTFPGTNSFTPTAAGFLGGGNAGLYAWHDYAEQDVGSGRIVREEALVAGHRLLFVTWNGVESWPLGVLNPGTMQFQLDLTTGVVKLVWTDVATNTASAYGSAHLVGYTPAGPSHDLGSINLATVLPLLTQPLNGAAMALSAAPAPVSNATVGTVVTYTTTNMPPFDPNAATLVYAGVHVVSVGQIPLGLDLTALGAPGCRVYVSSLDMTQTMVNASPTHTVTMAIPTLVPPGFELYSQSAALILPGSLPNGQNAFGVTLSNGVRQRIDIF